MELNHEQDTERPAVYDAGLGPPVHPLARRVRAQRLADEWTVVTRDIYADFGALNIRSLTIWAPDGQHLLIDHIYLARTIDDFRYLD